MDRGIIDEYEKGSGKLRKAVAGLSRADFLAFPVPGTWSIQQIVIHILDSDLIWTDRAKRVIAEENPTLIGYNETKFASSLHYDEYSIDDAITIFELNRKNFAKVLRKLPDAAFERKGTHNEAGELRLDKMIRSETAHVEHHLKFIEQKRAKLGKPL
jgi:uncharacterized damage-inducible protein DinB